MEAAAENIVSLFVAFYICFDVEIVLYISCYIVINFMLLLHDDATIFEIIICHGIAWNEHWNNQSRYIRLEIYYNYKFRFSHFYVDFNGISSGHDL